MNSQEKISALKEYASKLNIDLTGADQQFLRLYEMCFAWVHDPDTVYINDEILRVLSYSIGKDIGGSEACSYLVGIVDRGSVSSLLDFVRETFNVPEKNE